MSENNLTVDSLEARHVPESSFEAGPDGNRIKVDLPGSYVIGANVGGAFVPLAKIGAARLQKHIDRAQQASESAAAEQSQQASADTSSETDE